MRNYIRALRQAYDMTQAQLADLAGVSRVTVNRVESGKYIPDGRTMLKLAAALCVPAADVFPALAELHCAVPQT